MLLMSRGAGREAGRRWRVLGVPVLAAGLAVVPGVNAGGGTWHTARQIPGLAALATRHIDEVDSLSCASPGNCSAGGLFVTPANGDGGEPFVANQVGGKWGQAQEVPGMSGLELGDGGSDVNALSCPSAGNCSAGGEYVDGSGGQQAYVVDEVNGVWGTAQEAPGTPAINAGEGAGIESISCASAGNCSAVGQYSDTQGPLDQVFSIDEVNGTWGNAQPIPGSVALNAGAFASAPSISCPTAGNCAAGGGYSDTSNHFQAYVVNEVNGAWGTAQEVPGTAALNTGKDASVESVSCASPGNCTAAGSYTAGNRKEQAFVADESNGVWGTAQKVPGVGTAGSFVVTLSCTSAGNCSAGGEYTDASRFGQAFVAGEVNGTWGKAEEVPGTATLNTGGNAEIVSVSCASPGNCGGVGVYELTCTGIQCVNQQTFVVDEVNGTWGTAQEVPGTATLNVGNDAAGNVVSCTAPGKCTAGGFYAGKRATQQAWVDSET